MTQRDDDDALRSRLEARERELDQERAHSRWAVLRAEAAERETERLRAVERSMHDAIACAKEVGGAWAQERVTAAERERDEARTDPVAAMTFADFARLAFDLSAAVERVREETCRQVLRRALSGLSSSASSAIAGSVVSLTPAPSPYYETI